MPEYEFREMYVPRGVSRKDATRLLTDEAEYGRHVALFHPRSDFAALKARLVGEGAVLIDPIRPTPFERFFFREPVNGYVFEVIDGERAPR